MKQPVLRKQQFKFIFPIQTRWSDNDQYGHVNNVMYYSFFDTAANALLIQKCGFDLKNSPTIGLVVNSQCDFMQELSYPEIIEVGVSIAKIGNSSLTYALAIFKQDSDTAAAQGQFVHVFVDRISRQSVPIAKEMRTVLHNYLLNNTDIHSAQTAAI